MSYYYEIHTEQKPESMEPDKDARAFSAEQQAYIEKRRSEIGTDEGDRCNRDGCDGFMEVAVSENCSCHINPPCSSCVDAPLRCTECGAEVE